MDRFFFCYERAVKAFALLALLFMILYFSLWLLFHGGVTGALHRLMTGEEQRPLGQSGYLNLQSSEEPPAPSEEQPELIL